MSDCLYSKLENIMNYMYVLEMIVNLMSKILSTAKLFKCIAKTYIS